MCGVKIITTVLIFITTVLIAIATALISYRDRPNLHYDRPRGDEVPARRHHDGRDGDDVQGKPERGTGR